MRVEAQTLGATTRLAIYCNREQFANFQYLWTHVMQGKGLVYIDQWYSDHGIENFVIQSTQGPEVIFVNSEVEEFKDELTSKTEILEN